MSLTAKLQKPIQIKKGETPKVAKREKLYKSDYSERTLSIGGESDFLADFGQ